MSLIVGLLRKTLIQIHVMGVFRWEQMKYYSYYLEIKEKETISSWYLL